MVQFLQASRGDAPNPSDVTQSSAIVYGGANPLDVTNGTFADTLEIIAKNEAGLLRYP